MTATVTIYPSPYLASVAMEQALADRPVVFGRPHMPIGDLLTRLGGRVEMLPASRLALALVLEQTLLAQSKDDAHRDWVRRITPAMLRLFLALDLAPANSDVAHLLAKVLGQGEKAALLRNTWLAWRETLAERGLHTPGDIWRAVVIRPQTLDASVLVGAESWRFSGFTHLSPLELDGMVALADTLPAQLVLELPIYTGREDLYGPVLSVEAYIKRHAQNSRLELEPVEPPFALDETRAALVAEMFLPGQSQTMATERDAGDAFGDARIVLRRPLSTGEQLDMLVATVRGWMNAGIALREMAVVAPDIESVRPALRRAIVEYGLPLAYNRVMHVLDAPCFDWLHALAALLDDDGDSLHALTRCVHQARRVGLGPTDAMEDPDLNALEAYLRALGVEGLQPARVKAVLEGDAACLPLAESLALWRAWLAPFRDVQPLRQWIELISEQVNAMRLPGYVHADDARHFSSSWHAHQTVARILDEWRKSGSPVADDLRPRDGAAFLRWLVRALDVPLQLRSSPEPESIAVLSPEDAGRRPFRRVVVLDVLDGRFPQRAHSGDLLLDAQRRRFNDDAKGDVLQGGAQSYQRQRMNFVDLLMHSEYVECWAVQTGDDGDSLDVSPFWIDLERLCGVQPSWQGQAETTPQRWLMKALLAMRASGPAGLPDNIPADWRKRLQWADRRVEIDAVRESYLSQSDPKSRAELATAYDGRLPAGWHGDGDNDIPGRFGAAWFDSYAACPFQLFAARILGALDWERESVDVEARALGLAVHDCLESVVKTLDITRLQDRDGLEALVYRQLLQALERHTRHAAKAVRDAREIVARQWAVRLRQFLMREVEHWPEAAPCRFEVDFGQPDSALAEKLVIEGQDGKGFALVGRIDRIDEGPELRVGVDYKTSNNATGYRKKLNAEFGSSAFQMPIYLLAMLVANGDEPAELKQLAARYYTLGDANASPPQRRFDLSSPAVRDYFSLDADVRKRCLEAGRPNLANKLAALVARVQAGQFDVSPRGEVCKHCPYDSLCRIGDLPDDPDDEEIAI